MVELSCELLGVLDLEGAPVWSQGQPEEVDGACDEVRQGSDGHVVEVEDEAENSFHQSDKELMQLVPGYWVLAEHRVGFA